MKPYGVNIKTGTIKRGIPNGFKSLGRGLGAAAGLITVGDVLYNSELKPSHILDLTVTGLSFIPGAGWAIGGTYLILDVGFRVFTEKGIGDHLDAQFEGSIVDWDY